MVEIVGAIVGRRSGAFDPASFRDLLYQDALRVLVTSKWNKIEHRLFSFISQNWRGKPLVSHEVIVNLISATTTQTGLKVWAELDTNSYPPGAKVSKKQIQEINIRPDSFHGEWNYTIRPNT